jgi:RNA polymerase sigma-70 factor, ECF subfamily
VTERPNTWGRGRPPPSGGGLDSLDDAELVRQVCGGQNDAFTVLVRRYQDRVFNTCWRVCGHLEDARDLTQEAFLKAFEGLSSFRQESGFYTWIFRVALNLALSHRRGNQRKRHVSLDADGEGWAGQAQALVRRMQDSSAHASVERTGRAELHRAALRALQALDDDHRAVVVLRDMEGFDYQQISQILDVPPGTVKSRLHRARTAIQEAIRPTLGTGDVAKRTDQAHGS